MSAKQIEYIVRAYEAGKLRDPWFMTDAITLRTAYIGRIVATCDETTYNEARTEAIDMAKAKWPHADLVYV